MADMTGIRVIFTPVCFEMDFPAGGEFEKLEKTFRKDPWEALYPMGFQPETEEESATVHWLHRLALSFAACLTRQPALEITREQTQVPLDAEEGRRLLDMLPFGVGTEYVTQEWLQGAFEHLTGVFCREIAAYEGTVSLYLAERLQDLRIPERIFFHLVESKKEETPFAFLATYSTRDAAEKVSHQPLSYALIEYKGNREKLVTLLACLNRAADVCPLIAQFMETGELFHPLKLTAEEAYAFLKCVPQIEEAGISCRLPDWWRRKSAGVHLTVRIGEKEQSRLGFDSLLTMTPELNVDGVRLTREDIRKLLAQSDGLAMIKGKWVEVDREKLQHLLDTMESHHGDLSMLEAMRMQGGLGKRRAGEEDVEVTSGQWLSQCLNKLRHPQTLGQMQVPAGVHAQLRPYQETGFAWLREMAALGFGACLADDMGLGKTLQVLTFLQEMHEENPDMHALLIVPASLMGNWEKEAARFTPSLTIRRLHGKPAPKLDAMLEDGDACLTLTTYATANRMKGLAEREWDCLILDEAQAIKNAGAQQSRAVKKIPARVRIAMTGTPIENDLGNLWSLFDFLNKGLLGSAREFGNYTKTLSDREGGYAGLKRTVSPFILRRLKTDKSIIPDLPDKVEMTDYIELSRKQVTLYNKEVDHLAERLAEIEPKERSGLILQSLTRFKQLCNHPDQYLGVEGYALEESGKFEALRDICETVREKRERILVFTQYKEITPHLDQMLCGVFGRPGLVLHGEVKVSERQDLVERFNGDEYVPYMVLTIKAGGTGLNLTRANHVVLFDRWWNPAVESQAIDRAFRIGQTKDVMVHKFVARGTIEEKIQEMLSDKQALARDVVGDGSEVWLTKMSNDDIMKLVRLEG